jgi:hypothetical protein
MVRDHRPAGVARPLSSSATQTGRTATVQRSFSMFALMLMSAAVTAAQPFTFEGSGADSDRTVLHHALNAPERPRSAKDLHYCIKVEGDPTRTQVCRTARDWKRLGLIPLNG